MDEDKKSSAADSERLDAEMIRQRQENRRQAEELARKIAETARVAAETGRVAAAKEVSETLADLTALLERMEAVEAMRRTSRGQNWAD